MAIRVARVAFLGMAVLLVTGCAGGRAGTVASIPTARANYDQIFDAATQLVTRAGYNVTRADKASGSISGVKQIGGDSLHFNIVIRRVSESTIDVGLIRGGGGATALLLPTSLWKADAKNMLQHLAQAIDVPESQIMVTFGDERKPLDKF